MKMISKDLKTNKLEEEEEGDLGVESFFFLNWLLFFFFFFVPQLVGGSGPTYDRRWCVDMRKSHHSSPLPRVTWHMGLPVSPHHLPICPLKKSKIKFSRLHPSICCCCCCCCCSSSYRLSLQSTHSGALAQCGLVSIRRRSTAACSLD